MHNKKSFKFMKGFTVLEVILVILVITILSALGILYYNMQHGEYRYTSLMKKMHERLREKQTEAMRLWASADAFLTESGQIPFDIEFNETLVIDSNNLICSDGRSTCFKVENGRFEWHFVPSNNRIDISDFSIDDSRTLIDGCVTTRQFFWDEKGFPWVQLDGEPENRCVALKLTNQHASIIFKITKFGYITSEFTTRRPIVIIPN